MLETFKSLKNDILSPLIPDESPNVEDSVKRVHWIISQLSQIMKNMKGHDGSLTDVRCGLNRSLVITTRK